MVKICLLIGIHAFLLINPIPVKAIQCRQIGTTYNCENKEIYRKIGNRIFGPNGRQFLIQGNRISQIGSEVSYKKIDNRVLRNDGGSYTRQGSYILGKDKLYTKQGNLIIGNNHQEISIINNLL